MQIFEIKQGSGSFGVGMVLDLTDEQAEARKESLTKKGKYYVVNQPVSFKAGEAVGVVEGDVSKKLLQGLADLETAENQGKPYIKHMGFGKYDVFDKDGVKLTDKPIPKADAEKMSEDLQNVRL